MYGKYYIDDSYSGKNPNYFEGEYLESDVVGNAGGIPILRANHACGEQETAEMTEFLGIITDMLGLKGKGCAEQDIKEAEERLKIMLPAEVKAMYTAFDGNYKFVLDSKDWKLLSPAELTLGNGTIVNGPPEETIVRGKTLVFGRQGRTKALYTGLNLEDRHIYRSFNYNDKDEWYPLEDWKESFCDMMIEGAALTAINKLKCKGYFKITGKEGKGLGMDRRIASSLLSLADVYEGYHKPYSTIMVNKEKKTVIYIRQFLIGGDMYFASDDAEEMKKFRLLRGLDKE